MYRFTILKDYRVIVMYKGRNFSGGGGGGFKGMFVRAVLLPLPLPPPLFLPSFLERVCPSHCGMEEPS